MLKTATDVAIALYALFTYVPDYQQFGVNDDQRSYVEDLYAGREFQDDCDGFALTAVDALRRLDIPAWTVQVRLPKFAKCGPLYEDGKVTGCSLGHMIAVYHENGITWALDNRQTKAVPLSELLRNSMYRIR